MELVAFRLRTAEMKSTLQKSKPGVTWPKKARQQNCWGPCTNVFSWQMYVIASLRLGLQLQCLNTFGWAPHNLKMLIHNYISWKESQIRGLTLQLSTFLDSSRWIDWDGLMDCQGNPNERKPGGPGDLRNNWNSFCALLPPPIDLHVFIPPWFLDLSSCSCSHD